MQLKYTGPKPMISHTGIEFDKNKDDKYHYLEFVIHLLKALDHDYIDNKTYLYEPSHHHYSDAQMLELIRHYAPGAENDARARAEMKRSQLDAELTAAQQHTLLNDEERSTLEKNLRLMYDYRLQRTINKSFYYSAIGALAELIAEDHIHYIKAPLRQEYFHVFHTVEGIVGAMKKPIQTQMEVYEENGELMVRLDIANR
jgi:hypothetical protein